MLGAFKNQALWVWRHPLNSEDRLRAELRWLAWIVAGRLGSGRTYRWINETRFRAEPGQHGITRCISGRLEEPREMGFTLHFLRPGDLFVDCGANVGSYSLLAHAAGARVVAFEPDPASHVALCRNFEINDAEIEAHRCGVSDHDGTAFLTVGLGARNHLAEEGQTVALRTLDGVLDRRSPVLVKIDVEGAEALVIRGGEKALATCPAVIVEMLGHGERFGTSDREVHDMLTARGFRAARYDPFSRVLIALDGPDNQSVNTLYLRDLDAAQALVKTAPTFDVMGRRI